MEAHRCISRQRWQLQFAAHPEEVGGLRHFTRARLDAWHLPHLVDAAQLCVSELATNVIKHVGIGAPAQLVVEARGTALRIEVSDTDDRTVAAINQPARFSPDAWEREGGRGLELLGMMATRWGAEALPTGKKVWVELEAGSAVEYDCAGHGRTDRAEAVLLLYRRGSHSVGEGTRVSAASMGESAVDLLADLMHWLAVHGWDTDEVLDRAQMRFEAQVGAA